MMPEFLKTLRCRPCDLIAFMDPRLTEAAHQPCIPEEVLPQCIGTCGRWQILALMAHLIALYFCGLTIFMTLFVMPYDRPYRCLNATSWNDKCYYPNGSKCEQFEFYPGYGETLDKTYNLVCGREYLNGYFKIAWSMCQAVGYLFFGIFADVKGRKMAFFMSIVMQIIVGFFYIGTTQTFVSFVPVTCLLGMAAVGIALTATVTATEFSSNRWRTLYMGVVLLPAGGSYVTLALVVPTVQKILPIIVTLCISQGILLVCIPIIIETPSWLLAKGKFTLVEHSLNRMAHFNRRRLAFPIHIRPNFITAIPGGNSKLAVLMLFKFRQTRKLIIFLLVNWLAVGLGFGLTFERFQQNVRFHPALDRTWFGVAIGSGCAVAIAVCHLFHHRVVICVTTLIATCLLSIPSLAEDIKVYLISLSILFMALTALWNLSPREFWTDARCQCLGLSLCCSSVSIAVGRFVVFPKLPHRYYAPFYAVITLVVWICCFFHCNVHNRELPDVIIDSIMFSRSCKPSRYTDFWPVDLTTLTEEEVENISFRTN